MSATPWEDDSTEHELPDPGDYRQRKRLEDILTARKRVLEQKREADKYYHFDQIDELTRDTVLRSAVEEYIIEVEQLIRDCETERDYWGETLTGDGEPDESIPKLGSQQLPNGQTRVYWGLQSVIRADNPITVQWTEEAVDPVGGSTTETKQATLQLSADILMRAYRAVNAFLLEVDMDLDTEEDSLPVYGYEVVDEDDTEEGEDD